MARAAALCVGPGTLTPPLGKANCMGCSAGIGLLGALLVVVAVVVAVVVEGLGGVIPMLYSLPMDI